MNTSSHRAYTSTGERMRWSVCICTGWEKSVQPWRPPIIIMSSFLLGRPSCNEMFFPVVLAWPFNNSIIFIKLRAPLRAVSQLRAAELVQWGLWVTQCDYRESSKVYLEFLCRSYSRCYSKKVKLVSKIYLTQSLIFQVGFIWDRASYRLQQFFKFFLCTR